MNEDWDLLVRFFPPDWETLAAESGALRAARDHPPGSPTCRRSR